MPVPEPMLSTRGTRWSESDDWILQVKWDGFRLLVEIPSRGIARAWSRHGADLSQRLPGILEPLRDMPSGTTIDGELVALAQQSGRPLQDFAAVRHAVFNGDRHAARRLHFIAFALLSIDGEDLRARAWGDRDEQLRAALPACSPICMAESRP